MDIKAKNVLVTGANRGIGKVLVEEFAKHDVAKIYAAARSLESLPDFADERIYPLRLDVTRTSDLLIALRNAPDVDILVNNAGVLGLAPVIGGPMEKLEFEMNVNYFGALNVTRAFAPLLEERRGSIVNIITIIALASMAGFGGYAASKAALFSATQAMRAELREKGVSVFGVFPGGVDTDMTAGLEMPKTLPQDVAQEIVQGILDDQEDIFPDPMSKQMAAIWMNNPKALEKQFAAM